MLSTRAIAQAGLFALLAAAPAGVAADDRPLERNDLSICSGGNPIPAKDDAVDAERFASWLHGTWLLKTRTIQGVAVDTESKYYLDIDDIKPSGARGWAMMIDRGNLHALDYRRVCAACLADAAVGALWKVEISVDPGGHSAHLKMIGDYLGSYGDFRKGIQATEQTHFHQYGPVFLAGQLKSPAGGQGLEDDTWDRVSLSDGVFTYTSCKNGFIDRFVKISDQKPLVAGLDLRDAWKAIKASGTLVNPPALEVGK